MTDTVIFDLGGVLVDFHPVDGMRELGFSDDALQAFRENIFSGLWESCDRIPYEEENIRELFKSHVPGYEKEVDLLWDNLTVVTGLRPYSVDWIKSLKERGLKCYVLSNFGNCSFRINSKLYDFLPYMDGQLISYEIEKVKPEREIYEALLERFDIDREKAVFIDDRRINIDGAEACGIKGILFENYEQAKKDLEALI